MRVLKGFVMGMIVTIAISLSMSAFAEELIESIEVVMNNVNVSINGENVASKGHGYTLTNGDEVPFSILYKGTTYIPLRRVSEILGKEVGWEASTSTASINDSITAEDDLVEVEEKVEDKTKPEIESVVSKLNNIIEITFSEKIDIYSAEETENYRIVEAYGAKKEIDVENAKLDASELKVVLTLDRVENTVLYSIEVANIKDMNGNVMRDSTENVVGVSDEVPEEDEKELSDPLRVLDIRTTDDGKVYIIFDRDMRGIPIAYSKYFKVYNMDKGEDVPWFCIEVRSAHDEKGIHMEEFTETTRLKISISGYVHFDGVEMEPFEKVVTVVADDRDIYMEYYAAMSIDSNTVKLFFSKKLDEATVSDVTNYKITDSSTGDEIQVISARLGEENGQIILQTEALVDNQIYEAKIYNVCDLFGNTSDIKTQQFVGTK